MGAIKSAYEAGRLFNEFEPEVNVNECGGWPVAKAPAAKVFEKHVQAHNEPEAPEGFKYVCVELPHEMGWHPEGNWYELVNLEEMAENARRREEAWF